MIRLEFSKIDPNVLTRLIERKLQQKVQNISNSIYQNIYELDHRTLKYHSRYPYLTGSYMASWRIEEGRVDSSTTTNYFVGGQRKEGASEYFEYKGPYSPVYISNSQPYAEQLESEGSPLHKSPWHVAAHSVTVTVLKYRL